MHTFADDGRRAMQWLLLFGVLAAWATLDRSPRVVEGARDVVDRALILPQALGLPGDVLDGSPADSKASFAQYRYEFLQFADPYDPALAAENAALVSEPAPPGVRRAA
jgi:hypothetical protein